MTNKWINGRHVRTLRNYPKTVSKALHLHNLEEIRTRPGGPSNDYYTTANQTEEDSQTQASGDDLEGARPTLGACSAFAARVLAHQDNRPPPRRLAQGPQWHHLSDAFRLPVGPVTSPVRPQEHGPRLVPTLVFWGRHATYLGGISQGMR